jgi:malate dehydrogenase (oxaloacetate-decarboxylating)
MTMTRHAARGNQTVLLPRLRGKDLLDTPLLNKGTAFTNEERTAFGLHGLLPPQVESLEEQVVRAYGAYKRKTDDLERHIYLRALQDRSEVLFYALVLQHMEELMPVVYTPVVALGCQEFSHIYRRPRGLFIPYPLRESIPQLLRHRPNPDVDVIVVTDGERILGIGDQGVGGMGIPIGKLALYTLIGGIAPDRTLPIVLDVGTNNVDRLKDPEYLGWRHERLKGPEYFDFIERFVQAVKQELPSTLLQWEDFSAVHARAILERYRDQLLTFNDDIQGTGAITLAVVLSALNAAGGRIRDQTVVVLGAGSASVGVSDSLCAAMQADGLSEAEARSRFYLVNTKGLLHSQRTDLRPEQLTYAQPWEKVAGWAASPEGPVGLADVIHHVTATVLIGLSTLAGAFNESLVREMAKKTPRPVILPLSNPTAKAEAKPADLLRWTDGRALVATGSPFEPVAFGDRVIPIAQCNNVYIFPALGLGAVASGARRVTDPMILASARALADHSPARLSPTAPLLPPVKELRQVAVEIAVAAGEQAQKDGVAPPSSPSELREDVLAVRWSPVYPCYSVD